MREPTFSVIMPVYNAGYDALYRAVDSVVRQTFEDWELIIVDDGSIDGVSGEVFNAFPADSRRCLWGLEGNSGSPVVPRNFGVEESKGKWLAFLDADDKWELNKLKVIDNVLSLEGLYYHDMKLIGSWRGKNWSDLSRCYSGKIVSNPVFDKLLIKNFIPTSSVVIPKSLWRPMDDRLKVAHDWDLWLEIARTFPVYFIPQPLGTLTLHSGSVITDVRRRRAESREVVRRHRRHASLRAQVLATAYYYLVEVWDLWKSLRG